jgi:hypothetical protein
MSNPCGLSLTCLGSAGGWPGSSLRAAGALALDRGNQIFLIDAGEIGSLHDCTAWWPLARHSGLHGRAAAARARGKAAPLQGSSFFALCCRPHPSPPPRPSSAPQRRRHAAPGGQGGARQALQAASRLPYLSGCGWGLSHGHHSHSHSLAAASRFQLKPLTSCWTCALAGCPCRAHAAPVLCVLRHNPGRAARAAPARVRAGSAGPAVRHLGCAGARPRVQRRARARVRPAG